MPVEALEAQRPRRAGARELRPRMRQAIHSTVEVDEPPLEPVEERVGLEARAPVDDALAREAASRARAVE